MNQTAASFVARADKALYRAKLNGRNRGIGEGSRRQSGGGFGGVSRRSDFTTPAAA